jgi:alkanesulfonate monooxygenase SsuD/methylene tetrahydromethanopterin reductase-like flavin-dependent oxidoreductase (luciferase family)
LKEIPVSLPILFGANVDPVWNDRDQPLRQARDAERRGLDLVTVQDHPYQAAFYDTWTLLSYVAARTEHITVVPTVALPLRPPAMLAKAAASLDVLTGGRIQLGLGAGAFWDAIAAMGGPRRSTREAVESLDQALDVIHALWSGKRAVRAGGSIYSVSGVHPGPTPSAGLGVWVGSYGPKMLALTGAKAQGWMPSLSYLGLDRLGEASERIDDAAASAGRDPATLRKVYNVSGMIGPASRQAFVGPPAQWVDDIVDVVRRFRMNAFTYWPADDYDRQIGLFAEEVVPAVRAALS